MPSLVSLRTPLALVALLMLAACGGGIWIGDDDDEPPSVNLTASATAARPGETVRLAAAASDDFGVFDVAFFRVDAAGERTLLAVDSGEPYEISVPMPDTTDSIVRFFARARDDAGQRSDSALVSVEVLP